MTYSICFYLTVHIPQFFFFFFFNDTATTEIYTLSLHDALPIFFELQVAAQRRQPANLARHDQRLDLVMPRDRKSTRLNSSHDQISYAVFCLKKKKTTHKRILIIIVN